LSKEKIISQVVSEIYKKSEKLNKVYDDIFDVINDMSGLRHEKLYLNERGFGLDKKDEGITFDFTVNDWDFIGSERDKIILASPSDIDVIIRIYFDWLYSEKYITEENISKEELYNQLSSQLQKLTSLVKIKAKKLEFDGYIYADEMAYPMTEENDKVLPKGIYTIKKIDSAIVTKDYIEIELNMDAEKTSNSLTTPQVKQDISGLNVDRP